MKIRSRFAGVLLACSAGAVQAATISYTASRAHGGGVQGYASFINLPIFDPSRPEIPDDAILLTAQFHIQSSVVALVQFYNNTLNPLTFSGSARLASNYSGQQFSTAETFSFPEVPFGGVATAVLNLDDNFILTSTPNIDAGSYSVPRGVGFELANIQPTINQNPLTGTYLLAELLGASWSVTATYTYEVPSGAGDGADVPDGGATLPLLWLGLLSCRLCLQRWL